MKWYYWLLLTLLVLFLPIALFATILPANVYSAQGMEGAVDCDGPIGVMIFAIPGYIVYGSGILVFMSTYVKTRKTNYLLIILVCCSILAAITPNVFAAISQHNINASEYVETCGKGW